MKQGRTIPLVRSVVVLGLFSAGLTRTAASQKPQAEEPASSSSLTSALFFAPLPDAPGAAKPSPSATKRAPRPRVETSVAVGVFSQLSTTRTYYGAIPPTIFITDSFNPTAGVLGTFRQSFRPWLGYSVNFGYTSAVEHTTHSQGSGSGINANNYIIPNHIYEISATYLAQTRVKPKLTVFGEVGGGALIVQPTAKLAAYGIELPVPRDYRPLGVFGAGIDYHFNPQVAFRAEYRGQLYKYPDYGLDLAPRFYNFTSEPTVSLTYTFGRGTYHQ